MPNAIPLLYFNNDITSVTKTQEIILAIHYNEL